MPIKCHGKLQCTLIHTITLRRCSLALRVLLAHHPQGSRKEKRTHLSSCEYQTTREPNMLGNRIRQSPTLSNEACLNCKWLPPSSLPHQSKCSRKPPLRAADLLVIGPKPVFGPYSARNQGRRRGAGALRAGFSRALFGLFWDTMGDFSM